MKKLRTLFAPIILAAVLCGCATTLAPGGAYQGDTFLYQTDRTVVVLQQSLDIFVTWEYQNRTVILSNWPQITVAADKVRVEAPQWFAAINVARTAYLTVRDGPGASQPATMSAAKSRLTTRVNDAAAQVSTAQAAVNKATLAGKPVLRINAENP